MTGVYLFRSPEEKTLSYFIPSLWADPLSSKLKIEKKTASVEVA